MPIAATLNVFNITANGQCHSVQNTISLSGCLKDVKVPLVDIPGADVEFLGNPPIGNFLDKVWVIGDWCEPDTTYTFNWQFCVTDIDKAEGTHSGAAITTTTQSVQDDSFAIAIKKDCPKPIMQDSEEGCVVAEEVEVCIGVGLKKPASTKQVIMRVGVGEGMQKTMKTVHKKTDKPSGGDCESNMKMV